MMDAETADHTHDATTCGYCGGDVPGTEACPAMSDDRACAPAACCRPATKVTTTSVILHRSMDESASTFYSSLDGSHVTTYGGGVSPPDGLCVVAVKPWFLQISTEIAPHHWGEIESLGPYFRRADAEADAARMGIEIDETTHHPDSVRVSVILPDDYIRLAGGRA